MTYAEEWKALSARIRGLMQAGQLHAQFLAVRSSDSYGRASRLREQSERILHHVRSFRTRFSATLPPAAVNAIDDFEANAATLIQNTSGNPDARQERVWAALVQLAAFETEMSFILADIQEVIRARSERAFAHLQRSIVADAVLRQTWQQAFDDGEVACEKLGAVHLLLHGIWAFKVDAAGARTDLVFQEPASDLEAPLRYADGLVLTEWKKVDDGEEARQRFEEARSQAARYAQGPLAGTELVGYRYAVVVSRQQVEVPEDHTEDGVVYKHVNVSVEPRPPSRL